MIWGRVQSPFLRIYCGLSREEPGQHLTRLIEEMLDLSRLEQTQLVFYPAPYDNRVPTKMCGLLQLPGVGSAACAPGLACPVDQIREFLACAFQDRM